MTPPIEIVDYQTRWPREFAEIEEGLQGVLGDRALRIDHIGSTSVPGLAAKDIIDVQVTVSDLADERLRGLLEDGGYRWRADLGTDHPPPGVGVSVADLEKRVAQAPPDRRGVNIHFRVAGRFNHRYSLLCRDYLREHRAAVVAYAEIKRSLAAVFPRDVASYYAVKDPVFDLIMAAANDWAARTGWRP